MKYLIILAIAVSAEAAWAKTDGKANLEKLKTNAENSEANYGQYKSNRDISTDNVVETTKAIKELRKQRDQLSNNAKNADKNRVALDQMIVKINALKAKEQATMKTEEAQIAKVREVLNKLEANKKQREDNLALYDQKIKDAETEKATWADAQKSIVQINADLDKKEKEAMAEREKWLGKKQAYHDEALKWGKQNQADDQAYTKFKKLQD